MSSSIQTKLKEKQGIVNKNSSRQQQQSENGIFSHNLKKLFSMYKKYLRK